MSDGSQQGISPERAIRTILGGEPAPEKDDESSPGYWLKRLRAKDDNTGGYDAHAEVMAKYILRAYESHPHLQSAPNSTKYVEPIDWNNPVVLERDLSDRLKAEVYTDPAHPFRRALSEATGFTWGWAFNIARYALGLPPEPNPAIIEIG
jgi:hypothetical protein